MVLSEISDKNIDYSNLCPNILCSIIIIKLVHSSAFESECDFETGCGTEKIQLINCNDVSTCFDFKSTIVHEKKTRRCLISKFFSLARRSSRSSVFDSFF